MDSSDAYRYSELIPGLTVEEFVRHMLADHIETQLGGKMVKVKSRKATAA